MESNFQRILQDLVSDHQKRQQQEQVDLYVKILSSVFDKAVAYTNVVIIAGYVAFFAIWNYTRSAQSKFELIVTALLMASSCSVFVFWETYKMVVSARHFDQSIRLVEGDTSRFAENLAALTRREQLLRLRLGRVWKLVLFLTIIPALAAVILLVAGFVYDLLRLGRFIST